MENKMAIQHLITAKASDSDSDCFTIFQGSEHKAKKRAAQWQKDIDSGNYKNWLSVSKRTAVEAALTRGAKVTMFNGVIII